MIISHSSYIYTELQLIPMAENNEETKSSSYDRAQSLMKTELPEYVVNIFMASGYDRLESIAKINNEVIDEMIAYTNKTFDGDCLRYIASYHITRHAALHAYVHILQLHIAMCKCSYTYIKSLHDITGLYYTS